MRGEEFFYEMDRTRLDVTPSLVHRLLTAQAPDLASLPVEALPAWGTDNAMFRLGEELVVRIPRSGWAQDGVAKEARWLPALGRALQPVAVPEVVAVGGPSDDHPWTWAVYRWIAGEPLSTADVGPALVEQLAGFLVALREVELPGGPVPGPHNGFRGGPAVARDRWVRPAILEGPHAFDRAALLAWWEDALAAPPPVTAEPRWLHGDLTPNNLVVRRDPHGRTELAAVIDWGCLAVGDPACDLMIAWNLDASDRAALRAAAGVDDATWARGRTAAFWQWIGGAKGDPANEADRVISRVLAEG